MLNRAVVGARRYSGRSPLVETSRGGIRWKLDLNEGIDLAIYLGSYQKLPKRIADIFIRPGSCIVDIGANIGSHALHMARMTGADGRVVAIEPTQYAYNKLVENLRLNPHLERTIIPVHAALDDGDPGNSQKRAFYSRWPLVASTEDRHREHCGQLESVGGARFLPLDLLVRELRNSGRIGSPIAFIKLDVDGNELQVLKGAARTIMAERPAALIEIAPHVQDEVPGRFERLIETLSEFGYRLETASLGQPIPSSADMIRKMIKFGASMDVIARPA